MSVAVTVDDLRAEIGRFGPTPYLLTVSDDGRPHSVAVTVAWGGEELVMKCGRRTAANLRARPLVSLLWPPIEPGGYSLIVDGDARMEGTGDAAVVAVAPTRGVLHRPSAEAPRPGASCADDCVRLR
ncbi:MAG TPA: pyridoxamine 5'-phosphate oxidase family protein [Candidatus Limnocylindrales bacterium]|nr:pyridoxamine 5'-phosphate oxidase family protein [Candidatus Limnocylindrales bacterium]